MITKASIGQILSVWDDLCRAYYNDNSYGGNIAEVYAYRLMPYTHYKEEEEFSAGAKNDLIDICREFMKHYQCTVKIVDYPGHKVGLTLEEYEMINDLFDHRIHIQVLPMKHEHVRSKGTTSQHSST